jgi:predicted transport protein
MNNNFIMAKQKSLKLTIEDHLNNKPKHKVALFNALRERISKWDNVQPIVRGNYIGYWFVSLGRKSKLFVEVHIQVKKIKLHLRGCDYKNPSGVTISEVPDTHKWTLTKLVDLDSESKVDSVVSLVKQSFDYVK